MPFYATEVGFILECDTTAYVNENTNIRVSNITGGSGTYNIAVQVESSTIVNEQNTTSREYLAAWTTSTPGDYTVTATVSDAENTDDTITKTSIIAFDRYPFYINNFSFDSTTAYLGGTVSFTWQYIGGLGPYRGTFVIKKWDYSGNSQIISTAQVSTSYSYTFTSEGSYSFELTGYDSESRSSTTYSSLYVSAPFLQAHMTGPSESVYIGEYALFSVVIDTYSTYCTPYTYALTMQFNGNEVATATGGNIGYTPTTSGWLSASGIVTDRYGSSAYVSGSVQVIPRSVAMSISCSKQGTSPVGTTVSWNVNVENSSYGSPPYTYDLCVYKDGSPVVSTTNTSISYTPMVACNLYAACIMTDSIGNTYSATSDTVTITTSGGSTSTQAVISITGNNVYMRTSPSTSAGIQATLYKYADPQHFVYGSTASGNGYTWYAVTHILTTTGDPDNIGDYYLEGSFGHLGYPQNTYYIAQTSGVTNRGSQTIHDW